MPSGGGGCATPDEALDRFWAPRGPGWTGGDGGWSVPLPDGRVLWLFGDSFLGRVALATRPGAYRLRFVRVPAGCLPAG